MLHFSRLLSPLHSIASEHPLLGYTSFFPTSTHTKISAFPRAIHVDDGSPLHLHLHTDLGSGALVAFFFSAGARAIIVPG